MANKNMSGKFGAITQICPIPLVPEHKNQGFVRHNFVHANRAWIPEYTSAAQHGSEYRLGNFWVMNTPSKNIFLK